MTGVFPSIVKTAKVVPFLIEIHNYIKATTVQSPCYQILKKYLKILLCIRTCIPFLIRIMLSLTYSLDSDNSILHIYQNILASLFSIHNAISLSRHEQLCLIGLRFKK